MTLVPIDEARDKAIDTALPEVPEHIAIAREISMLLVDLQRTSPRSFAKYISFLTAVSTRAPLDVSRILLAISGNREYAENTFDSRGDREMKSRQAVHQHHQRMINRIRSICPDLANEMETSRANKK